MQDDVESVRSRIDIVDLIGERVQLKKTGSTWRGLCPFHTEKTPSFYVNPHRGRFTCFGCQATGDIFDWTMRTENVDFRGALEILAQRAGLQLSKRNASTSDSSERALLLLEITMQFFRDQLLRSEDALSYAHSRGLDDATIAEWEIGFAPDDDEALPAALRRAGLKLEDAYTCGLVTGSQSEGFRPFFRGRLMFPIRNDKGRVVAFGGRALASDEPKYINSRESPLFSKSVTLYGMHRAKKALQTSREIVITEGYLDVIACHRAGITNAVAPLGTALAERNVEVIRRWADRVTLLYDSDEAGRKAARRAGELLKGANVKVNVGVLPLFSDPDSLFRSVGPSALRDVVASAVSPLRFEIASLKQEHGESSPEFWERAKIVLSATKNLLERDEIISELAALHPNARYSVQETINALRTEINQLSRKTKTVSRRNAANKSSIELPSPHERMILRAALREEYRSSAWPTLSEEGLITSARGRAIADELLFIATGDEMDAGEVFEKLSRESLEAFRLMERPAEGPVTGEALDDSIRVLRKRREQRELLADIESGGSEAKLQEYFRLRAGK